eukprot:TRINITY_DN29810_c0_g1_i1.p1 TRINITY_DN29810_c0_g1~~TRINITY_DN29810_c0_g1_i1.p1  ORF type:complete len:149 (+),score=31.99 TRINITY_DN29810_c0_g1_i1:55-501(+)
MSGPAITKYESADQKPTPEVPPSYDAAMSGQFTAPPSMDTKPYQQPSALYQAYPPQTMQPQPQVVTQVQYIASPSYGSHPVTLVCPQCQKNITTRTSSEPSQTAWILGIVLCVLGCVPCCLIPCCMDSMKQVTHSCPSCNSTLGRFTP